MVSLVKETSIYQQSGPYTALAGNKSSQLLIIETQTFDRSGRIWPPWVKKGRSELDRIILTVLTEEAILDYLTKVLYSAPTNTVHQVSREWTSFTRDLANENPHPKATVLSASSASERKLTNTMPRGTQKPKKAARQTASHHQASYHCHHRAHRHQVHRPFQSLH